MIKEQFKENYVFVFTDYNCKVGDIYESCLTLKDNLLNLMKPKPVQLYDTGLNLNNFFEVLTDEIETPNTTVGDVYYQNNTIESVFNYNALHNDLKRKLDPEILNNNKQLYICTRVIKSNDKTFACYFSKLELKNGTYSIKMFNNQNIIL